MFCFVLFNIVNKYSKVFVVNGDLSDNSTQVTDNFKFTPLMMVSSSAKDVLQKIFN